MTSLPWGLNYGRYLRVESIAEYGWQNGRPELTADQEQWLEHRLPQRGCRIGGASFQLPLCIALWGLFLSEYGQSVSYLQAAERFFYTGSLCEKTAIDGVDAKARLCQEQCVFNKRGLVVLTRNGTGPHSDKYTKVFHQLSSVFEYVFAYEGCDIQSFDEAQLAVQNAALSHAFTQPKTAVGLKAETVLARYIPRFQDYRQVCRQLAVPISSACEQLTPRERWYNVLRYCQESNRLGELFARAAMFSHAKDLKKLLNHTDAPTHVTIDLPTWPDAQKPSRIIESLLRSGVFANSAAAGPDLTAGRVLEFLGLWSLQRLWGREAPRNEHLKGELARLDSAEFEPLFRDSVGKLAIERKLVSEDAEWFRKRNVGEALAANYLMHWFQRDQAASKSVVGWMVGGLGEPYVNRWNRRRMATLQLLVLWRDTGREAIERQANALLDIPSETLSLQEKRSIRKQLVPCDLLLREGGVSSDIDMKDPASIRRAYLDGAYAAIAHLLEDLGVRTMETYRYHFERLSAMRAGRDYLHALARGMRRLLEGGTPITECPDDLGLRTALRAAVPTAGLADCEAVERDDAALEWWLQVLSCTATELQIRSLCNVYRAPPGSTLYAKRRQSGSAANVLAAQFDLRKVYHCLGDAVIIWRSTLAPTLALGDNFSAGSSNYGIEEVEP